MPLSLALSAIRIVQAVAFVTALESAVAKKRVMGAAPVTATFKINCRLQVTASLYHPLFHQRLHSARSLGIRGWERLQNSHIGHRHAVAAGIFCQIHGFIGQV
jgi:hypothetical protein